MTGRTAAIISVFAVSGAVAGVALAYLADYAHWWSPDNVLAGAACGFGGLMAGLLTALFAAVRIGDL